MHLYTAPFHVIPRPLCIPLYRLSCSVSDDKPSFTLARVSRLACSALRPLRSPAFSNTLPLFLSSPSYAARRHRCPCP